MQKLANKKKLTNKDYENILHYYKKTIPKTKKQTQIKATKIIMTKLCRCIKKLDKTKNNSSVGICRKSVVNRKGLNIGTFTCKNKLKNMLTKRNK